MLRTTSIVIAAALATVLVSAIVAQPVSAQIQQASITPAGFTAPSMSGEARKNTLCTPGAAAQLWSAVVQSGAVPDKTAYQSIIGTWKIYHQDNPGSWAADFYKELTFTPANPATGQITVSGKRTRCTTCNGWTGEEKTYPPRTGYVSGNMVLVYTSGGYDPWIYWLEGTGLVGWESGRLGCFGRKGHKIG